MQGELCTAQSTNKPSRENFVPHTGPPPGQNSPHTKPGGSNRYKTLPAGSPNGPTRDKTLPTHHKTAIPSHFSLAGRTISRLRQRQAEQGELCTAHRTTCGTKLSPLVIKRSFWPVLRMQGEFYPGYDIRGPQQGEFYPGILVALGLHPGSAMIIHVLLARQRP